MAPQRQGRAVREDGDRGRGVEQSAGQFEARPETGFAELVRLALRHQQASARDEERLKEQRLDRMNACHGLDQV